MDEGGKFHNFLASPFEEFVPELLLCCSGDVLVDDGQKRQAVMHVPLHCLVLIRDACKVHYLSNR